LGTIVPVLALCDPRLDVAAGLVWELEGRPRDDGGIVGRDAECGSFVEMGGEKCLGNLPVLCGLIPDHIHDDELGISLVPHAF